jgi:fructose-specific component phosphotransferase system IIB-like protein
MKIESIIRRKHGTVVKMGDMTYHFQPAANDERHLEEVTNNAHIARFLSIPEGYRVPEGEAAPSQVHVPAQDAVLLGSSKHEASYEIGGKFYQLGDLVRMAFDESDYTVPEWNALADAEREAMIQDELDLLKGSALEETGAPKTPAEVVILGSDWEPKEVDIAGKSVLTKDIVEAAFNESGLTLEAWNAQAEDVVIGLMSAQVTKMTEAAKPQVVEKPAETKTPVPEKILTPAEKRKATLAAKAAAKA